MCKSHVLGILSLLILVLACGCSEEKITAPRETIPQGTNLDIMKAQGGVVTMEDLKSGLGTEPKMTGPDVAIIDFSCQPVVLTGDVLTLEATVGNLGESTAVGPFSVWIGVLGRDFKLVRVDIDQLLVGESRSGVVHFDVPMAEFAQSFAPGDYTLYCSHDFSDTNPVNNYLLQNVKLVERVVYGTIMIDADPDALNAPWSLVGPDTTLISGNGDVVFPFIGPGNYTLNWDDISGYVTPDTQTIALAADDTVTFYGEYIIPPGTVHVVVSPAEISAPWTLTGPDNYEFDGLDNETIANLVPGLYRINWGAVAGYSLPTPYYEYQTLYPGGEITFAGNYQGGGSVYIDPTPHEINAPWTLVLPDGSQISGEGAQLLPRVALGFLTITWGDVEGYLTPDPEVVEMHANQNIVLSGVYLAQNGDAMGLYFDTEGTQICADAVFLSHISAYILYTTPSIPVTRGFECGLDFTRPGGRTFDSTMSVSYPLNALDVGTNSPVDGTYNFITGYSDPMPTLPVTVLATLDIFFLETETVTMTLRAANPSSSDNNLPMVMLEDFSLQDVFLGNGSATLATAGECGGTSSFERVNNLFN